MKTILTVLLVLTAALCKAQQKAPGQKKLLAQYIGNWVSANAISDTVPGPSPAIKMSVTPKMDSGALQIEVWQLQGGVYVPILQELICYDAVTNQIVGAGQNKAGQCFTGKGHFINPRLWVMEDRNFKGEPTLKITFQFMGANMVYLKGNVPGAKGWEVKYIKVGG
jgi:hypothetical protein